MEGLSTRDGMRAFANPVAQLMFNTVESILRPYIKVITYAFGPYLPTTSELNHPFNYKFQKWIVSPLSFVLIFILMIPMFAVFVLRNLLHQFRRPYCLSVSQDAVAKQSSSFYTVATGNLCLMPEIMSKFNNLDNTAVRGKTIGERIVVDQRHYTGLTEKQMAKKNGGLFSGCLATSNICTKVKESSKNMDFRADIITHFPAVDFLCLQETFDRDVAKILLKELHKVYPWILYDVGYNSPRLNYCGLNSGLMFASKYKILDAQFKPYTKSCGFCSTVSKGLLMVKVFLDCPKPGIQHVGYVFNTHLQAFQGLYVYMIDFSWLLKHFLTHFWFELGPKVTFF
ncbi:Sphingomyelin phosphodiesterase 3 [Mactra antiquata]